MNETRILIFLRISEYNFDSNTQKYVQIVCSNRLVQTSQSHNIVL